MALGMPVPMGYQLQSDFTRMNEGVILEAKKIFLGPTRKNRNLKEQNAEHFILNKLMNSFADSNHLLSLSYINEAAATAASVTFF